MGKYSLRQKPKISASCLVLVFTPLANGMAMGLCWEVLILWRASLGKVILLASVSYSKRETQQKGNKINIACKPHQDLKDTKNFLIIVSHISLSFKKFWDLRIFQVLKRGSQKSDKMSGKWKNDQTHRGQHPQRTWMNLMNSDPYLPWPGLLVLQMLWTSLDSSCSDLLGHLHVLWSRGMEKLPLPHTGPLLCWSNTLLSQDGGKGRQYVFPRSILRSSLWLQCRLTHSSFSSPALKRVPVMYKPKETKEKGREQCKFLLMCLCHAYVGESRKVCQGRNRETETTEYKVCLIDNSKRSLPWQPSSFLTRF